MQSSVHLLSLNCNGLNSTINDVFDILSDRDNAIFFICEHWLRIEELNGINTLCDSEGLWSHFKSSVDPEENLSGRPYGGVGFICKRANNKDYSFRIINIDNDRISALQVTKNGKVLLNVIGVYLPFYNGRAEQTILYTETLDAVQSILESCSNAPVVVMGDMNAALPQSEHLNSTWYRHHPFNSHSMQLYDFLFTNEMVVANFSFQQEISYTYRKGQHRTYIDHVFMTRQAIKNVSDCKVLQFDECWTSDHFPLETVYNLYIPCETMADLCYDQCKDYSKLNWQDPVIRTNYSKNLTEALSHIDVNLDFSTIDTVQKAQDMADQYCDRLTSTIHRVCANISPSNSKKRGPRRNPWWSAECTSARNRTRFWRKIWIDLGRNRQSTAFVCYKHAKKLYRHARRTSLINFNRNNNRLLNQLFRCGNTKKFWNQIKSMKRFGNNSSDIDMATLESFFTKRFESSCAKSDVIDAARKRTEAVFQRHSFYTNHNISVTREDITSYVKRLKLGRCGGSDGILAEHMKYGLGSGISRVLSVVMTICVRFSVLPASFRLGTLIPVLKKPTLDPSVAKSYRPIIVSSIFSKLLEYAILDTVSHHVPHGLQFGYIPQRNTATAISGARDVINYFNTRGSPVYTCALDAEMAFDGIPHCVLLEKALDIIPEPFWRIIYIWYKSLEVCIKHNGFISDPFKVCKGTRQGGLTSPFLFNLFYFDLVQELSCAVGGLRVGNESFNVFAYADDLLLMSSTVRGLQQLIAKAHTYVKNHGINFNASKTKCAVFGKSYLSTTPTWYLEKEQLCLSDNIEYLGAVISNNSSDHKDSRLKACRTKYYIAKHAGMDGYNINPDIVSYFWKVAIQPALLYANECVPLRNSDKLEMDKLQAKLIKTSLGLSKYLRSSALLQAMRIKSCAWWINVNSLKMLSLILNGSSQLKSLYLHMLNFPAKIDSCNNLVTRCQSICDMNSVSLFRCVLQKDYLKNFLNVQKRYPESGLADSIMTLLKNYNDRSKELIKLLLSPF